jgi:galactonate dehydratase
MRIEQIETIAVDRYLFVQISTDTGLVGLGEAGMWAYTGANRALIDAWRPYLLGQDPLRIEHHWQYLNRNAHFRGSAVSGALGAIDIALWDISGKHFGVPVYQLLGGKVRDRVRVQTQVYATSIDGLVEQARRDVARGITAIRITPFSPDFASQRHDVLVAEAVARVGALREAVGPGVDIGVEIHRRLAPADAIVLAAALEPFRPLYYEDPIVPDSVLSQAEVARAVRLPIATGERLNSLYEFRELLASGGARYVRVDPMLAGGLSSAKKIAGLAEAFHAGVMPHGVTSTVGTAVSVQLDACIPNFVLQDFLGDDVPPKSDLLVDNLVLEDGYLRVPDRPGIGVELKPGIAERYPPTARPIRTPLHEDGSVADS